LGDYDNDGWLDLFVTNFGNGGKNRGGNANAWLTIKLVGTRSNRSAIGESAREDDHRGQELLATARDHHWQRLGPERSRSSLRLGRGHERRNAPRRMALGRGAGISNDPVVGMLLNENE